MPIARRALLVAALLGALAVQAFDDEYDGSAATHAKSIPDPGLGSPLPADPTAPQEQAVGNHDDGRSLGEEEGVDSGSKKRPKGSDSKRRLGRHSKKGRRRGLLSMLGMSGKDEEGNAKP